MYAHLPLLNELDLYTNQLAKKLNKNARSEMFDLMYGKALTLTKHSIVF